MFITNVQIQSRSVLNAVALQDHLVKSLSLQDPFKPKVNHKANTNVNQKKTAARKSKTKLDDNKEYVLDAKPKPLTLGMGTLVVFLYWYIVMLDRS